MKRLVLAGMAILVFACAAFGDIPSREYFRRRYPDFLHREAEARVILNVRAFDSENNTLAMYATVYGTGKWSYRINNATAGEKIASESRESSGRDRKTTTWQYEIPEPGKSLRYAVIASFKPSSGAEITARKHVTIRNVKGVVQIVIE